MKKYKNGYLPGVFDMFHIGHLNVLKNAKEYCENLIVAVSSDDLVINQKKKIPVIPFEDRAKIVEAIRYVDRVVMQTDYFDKVTPAKKYNIDAVFVGDDWKGSDKWNTIERQLKEIGVDVVYLPYTHSVSSTFLRDKLDDDEEDDE